MVDMERAIPLMGVMVVLGLLGGCAAYEPAGLDRTRPAYQTDLVECQDNEPVVVDAYNAKLGLRWLASFGRRPFQVRDAIRTCMAGKGYAAAH